MAEDGALIFDPLTAGLFRQYVTDHMIDHGRWLRAVAEHAFVGECRNCGAKLRPEPPEDHGGIKWYEAACVSCGKIVAAPATISRGQDGGRVLARSSRHHQMPDGWWPRRVKALRAAAPAESEAT